MLTSCILTVTRESYLFMFYNVNDINQCLTSAPARQVAGGQEGVKKGAGAATKQSILLGSRDRFKWIVIAVAIASCATLPR